MTSIMDLRLEQVMEEAKPKAALKGLAEGAAPSFPSGSKAGCSTHSDTLA